MRLWRKQSSKRFGQTPRLGGTFRKLAYGFAAAALLLASPSRATGVYGLRTNAKISAAAPLDAAPFKDMLQSSAGGAKLTLKFLGALSAESISARVLAQPDRLVLDLPEVAFQNAPPHFAAASKKRGTKDLVRSFRFGRIAPGRSRIVIDLENPAQIQRIAVEPQASGRSGQIEIELAASDAPAFQRAAANLAPAAYDRAAPLPIRAPQTTAAQSDEPPIVVLDPGHGGADTGAASATAVLEKNVVFGFADAVRKKLEAKGKVRVVMTRADDTFIPLGERVEIAEKAKASLFVSIHADTLVGAPVHGATVYTLSDRASDDEAARLAAKENAADRIGGAPEYRDKVDVGDILFDLTRRETRILSHIFGRSLISKLSAASDLNKNPERSAGFRVLKAPDVPSVLLELGYLSSEIDLARLTSDEWRDKTSALVAEAIENYFADQRIAKKIDGEAAVAAVGDLRRQ